MPKFGLPCAFFGKSDFQLEKYMQFKEKDVYIFSCSTNVTVTSQYVSVICTYNNRIFCCLLYLKG